MSQHRSWMCALGAWWCVWAMHAHAWTGVVTHVSDGDTVWVRPWQGGEARKVRVQGIDAPEHCQYWGPQSQQALQAVLLNQVVDVQGRYHDSYGRLLARVYRQGQDVGAWMVTQGHAWSYHYQHNLGPYAAQQAYAQTYHLGLFISPNPVEPRWFRKRFGPCP
jgi:micrococcal nuclease